MWHQFRLAPVALTVFGFAGSSERWKRNVVVHSSLQPPQMPFTPCKIHGRKQNVHLRVEMACYGTSSRRSRLQIHSSSSFVSLDIKEMNYTLHLTHDRDHFGYPAVWTSASTSEAWGIIAALGHKLMPHPCGSRCLDAMQCLIFPDQV